MGIIECSGGIPENSLHDFLVLTRYNHREKGLAVDTSKVVDWRQNDLYHAEKTEGMVEEAFKMYYSKI